MAKVTNLTLRHKMIYQIYIRNYSKTGDFQGVIDDLPRLKALGVDIINLMSIFPTQVGTEGNGQILYAESFERVNPEYGDMVAFMDLVDAIHDLDMQVVLNFPLTSMARSAELLTEEPAFFKWEKDGSLSHRITEEEEVVDLDFKNPKMWDDLIAILKFWAKYVDGFAIQHAQYIRPEFWQSARAEVEDVHQYFYWLGGQIGLRDLYQAKRRKLPFWTEGELYLSFDVLNIEPVKGIQQRFLRGQMSMENYAYLEDIREMTTPSTSVMDRGLEFVPSERFSNQITSAEALVNWTAMSIFQKGIASLMMGQEYGCRHPIPLHEKKVLAWEKPFDMSDMLARLARIKKREIMKAGLYYNEAASPHTIRITYEYYDEYLFGFFQLKTPPGEEIVTIPIPDGIYEDILNEEPIEVQNGHITLQDKPVIVAYEEGNMK